MSAPAGPESGIQHVALLPGSRALSEMPIQVITDSTILAIRFHSPITSDLMAQLSSKGLDLGPSIDSRTWVVRAGPIAEAIDLSTINASAWTDLGADLRIAPDLLTLATGPEPATVRVNILAWDSSPATIDAILQHGLAIGLVAEHRPTASRRIVAEIPAQHLLELAAHHAVVWIDRWSAPETDLNLIRHISGVNSLESLIGLDGTGVTGEVMDSGIRVNHQEFAANPPILRTTAGSDFSHGTPVFGIIFGSGQGNPATRGVLSGAMGIFSRFTAVPDRAAHALALVQSPFRAVFQSNSWGGDRTRHYTTLSAELDDIAIATNLLILQSQSNSGNADSRPEAWSKNVLSIGAINHYDNAVMLDDRWAQSASTGPAIDGRIKPDLAHANDRVFTSSGSGNAAYEEFGGTSASTPIVAGLGGLVYRMWADGIFGNPVNGGDVFDERPASTTIKALLINTARQWDFSHVADDLGRYRQGWGMPHVQDLYDLRHRMIVINQSEQVATGAVRMYHADVAPGEPKFQATLVYFDPPGFPGALSHTINDISLRVTAPDGSIYWGNHGLLDSTTSVAGGQSDPINTVEQVIIANPMPGSWVIEVIGIDVQIDMSGQNDGISVPYSLVVSGGIKMPDAIGLSFGTSGLPETRDPYRSLVVPFQLLGTSTGIDPQTVRAFVETGGPTPLSLAATHLGGNAFEVTLPPAMCGTKTRFSIEGLTTSGQVQRWPELAPLSGFEITVEPQTVYTVEQFTTPAGWVVTNSAGLTGGAWGWGTLVGGGHRGDPIIDADGSGTCWMTDPAPGNSDVDGGPTTLRSPQISIAGIDDPQITFAYWLFCDDAGVAGEDVLEVEIAPGASNNWMSVATLRSTFGWRDHTIAVRDYIPTGNAVRIRFIISDVNNDSVTEAAIDHVRVWSRACSSVCPVDLNSDGILDFFDVQMFLNLYTNRHADADINGDSIIDFFDIQAFLNLYAASCD
ncbi:MAG: S8 family serine peptidase [Phycisphaeraceae bacterium]|nr:S8 family serine peptidase [Phycisphaeraceae bacterium]MCW5763454.1 S8 family serine peptidase [Phycisphaeraceae bacterium]